MMLDLSVVMQRLTQGQPPAEMTTLSAPQTEAPAEMAESGAPAAPTAPAPATPGAPPMDAHRVAGRVYELMRQDLLVFNERRGRR